MAETTCLHEHRSMKKNKKWIWQIFFLRWWIMQYLQKLENVRKHRHVNLVTTERRMNYLVSETACHTTNFFTEHLSIMEMKRKAELLVNKSVYLGFQHFGMIM